MVDEPDEATRGGEGDGAGMEEGSEVVPKPKTTRSIPAEDGSSDEWEEHSKGKSRKVGSSNTTAAKSMRQRPKRRTVEMFEIGSCDKGDKEVQE